MSQRVLGVVLLSSVCGVAWAGPKDFVVSVPGMGSVSAQAAKPYLDLLLRQLEKDLHWPASSANGDYLEDAKQLHSHLETKKPGFGMLALPMILELGCKRGEVTPLAQVKLTTAPAVGQYHVVVKGDAVKKLEQLEGKKLASNHLKDPKFVSRVIFAGKLDAAKFFQLASTPSPLKPIRQVEEGQVDAALLDDAQLGNLKTLPGGGAGLHTIFSSEPVPLAAVVGFDKVAGPTEQAEVKRALLALCGKSADVCKSLQVTRFEAVDARSIAAAMKSYCKP